MAGPETPTHRAARAAAEWREERPDIDPSSMELLGRMGEIAHLLDRDWISPFFARFGLQRGEFDVLATLRRAGAPHALTPTALYEAAMMSSGGMTARIDRLEKAGLVERRKHPTDRRGTLVALTPAGKALVDDIVPQHVQNQRNALAALSSEEQKALTALLSKLLDGLLSPRP